MTATELRFAALLVAMAPGLAGCGAGWFTDRERNPVIEDYVGGTITGNERVGFMATTASHRLVTIRLKTDGGVGRTGQMCPEPPPDVAQALSSSFAAALGGSVTEPKSGAQAEAQAALARTFATTVTPLLRRSPGLQYHRDAMYYLCVAYLNEAITQVQFHKLVDDIRKDAKDILLKEAENPTPFIPVTVTATDPAKSAEEIITRLRQEMEKIEKERAARQKSAQPGG